MTEQEIIMANPGWKLREELPDKDGEYPVIYYYQVNGKRRIETEMWEYSEEFGWGDNLDDKDVMGHIIVWYPIIPPTY